MKKRIFFLLLCAAIALSLFACSSESPKDSETPKETPSQELQRESPSLEPTDEPVAPTTTEPKATLTEDEEQTMSLDSLCLMIESLMSGNFDGCSVSHTDNMITVSIWADGIAMDVIKGGETVQGEWEILKENMVTLSNSISDIIDTAGRTDVYLMLNLLNDLNHDNLLLSATEGVVIYDVMAE